MAISKKLEIIYHNGQPDGIRSIRRHLSTMTTYVIPRPLLAEARKLSGINRPGIYYLISENDDNKIAQIYIGQTRNGVVRLDEHNRSKDFWNKAIMFLADNKTFSLDMISGLEAYAIGKAHDAKRYKVENAVNPKYEIDEYDLPLIEEVYEEIQFIMGTQGYKMENAKTSLNAEHVLHTTRNGIKAFGVYNGETFEVLEDSEINMNKEVNLKKYNVQRKELLNNGGIVLSADGIYRLTTTLSFNSPSGASDFVIGGSTNGWVEWKDRDGKTLNELYREYIPEIRGRIMKKFFIVLFSLLLLVLPFMVIGFVYLVSQINIFDNPDYWYGYLAYFGTVVLAAVAVWQNRVLKEENDAAQEKLENLTIQANEQSAKVIEIEQNRYRLELRPFVLVSNWEAFEIDARTLADDPKEKYIQIGLYKSGKALGLALELTNTTQSCITVQYNRGILRNPDLCWGNAAVNQENLKMTLAPGDTDKFIFYASPEFMEKQISQRVTVELTLENRFSKRYKETFVIIITSLSDKVSHIPGKWHCHLFAQEYTIGRLEKDENGAPICIDEEL